MAPGVVDQGVHEDLPQTLAAPIRVNGNGGDMRLPGEKPQATVSHHLAIVNGYGIERKLVPQFAEKGVVSPGGWKGRILNRQDLRNIAFFHVTEFDLHRIITFN